MTTPVPPRPWPAQPPPQAPQAAQPWPGSGYAAPPPGYGYPPPPPPVSPGGAPLAEFTDRLVARIIDSAILGGATAVVILPIYLIVFFSLITSTTNGYPNEPDPFAVLVPLFGVMAGLVVLALVLAYLYEVELMFRSGQTVGKRVMKIQVIPVDPTQPLTRVLAAKRFLAQHGCSFLPGLNWLDGLWQLWDKPYRQCLHDKFANTLVIKLKP